MRMCKCGWKRRRCSLYEICREDASVDDDCEVRTVAAERAVQTSGDDVDQSVTSSSCWTRLASSTPHIDGIRRRRHCWETASADRRLHCVAMTSFVIAIRTLLALWVVNSVKEVMFYWRLFVCLLATSHKTTDRIFIKKLGEMYLRTRKNFLA